MTVIDVTAQDFEREVLERSKTTPVVVDFWAEWCGPCRQLGPVLERATAAREGKVVLAKLDTDKNPQIAQAFRIQGIPAVKAFKDGRIVDEFTGNLPPAQVEAFLDRLLPSEAETLAAAGDEESLRRAVELEPGRAEAAVPLARILLGRGETDAALAILDQVTGSFAADGLKARIRLAGDATLAPAWTAIDGGDPATAIDVLLEAIGRANGEKDDLRVAIVGILDELGVEHPLARDARRRLASALY